MLVLLVALLAQAPPQTIATVHLQGAILSTAEGKSAAARLQAEWNPRLAALTKKEADLQAEREKLEAEGKVRHGWWPFRHAMSAKKKVMRQAAIQSQAKALQRERDDDQADFEKERIRVLNDLGGKMRQVIERYAKEKGYAFVLETGSPQTNVVVGQNDITAEIIKLYNQTYPASR